MDDEEGVPLQPRQRGEGVWHTVRRRLPVLEWAREYDRTKAVADLVAGVTLGITLVPQSIAYASLANLPVQYGLYSSYVGTILYVALGTVKEVSIGPTSLMALLTLQLCRGLPIEFVILLTFLSGVIVLIMGLLRLGFLVSLISPAVTSGFTSGTAVIVVATQLKGVLGLSFVAESAYDNLRLTLAHCAEVRAADMALAAACCSALLLLRKVKDLPVSPKRARLKKALWLVSISRNFLVVMSASLFAFFNHDPAQPWFKLSGRVEAGLPRVSLPPFSASVGNSTVGFPGMLHQLGGGLLMVPVVMVIMNIAIAKAFSAGGQVRATQEMLTLGLCNVASALVHAMPTCGAITRSAVSHSSGVRTPLAGLYSGLISLMALIFLTQYFYFIPKACLSSVLICAVIFMIDVSIVPRLWQRDRVELCILALTFCACLARSVEEAVVVGVAASLGALVRRLGAAPVRLALVKTERGEVCVVRPSPCSNYLNAENLADRVHDAANTRRPVLVECSRLAFIDYSACEVLKRLVSKAKSEGSVLIFYHVPEELVPVIERIPGVETRALRARSAARAVEAAAGRAGAGLDSTPLLAGPPPDADRDPRARPELLAREDSTV